MRLRALAALVVLLAAPWAAAQPFGSYPTGSDRLTVYCGGSPASPHRARLNLVGVTCADDPAPGRLWTTATVAASVPLTRTLTFPAPLLCDGTATCNLSANRTLTWSLGFAPLVQGTNVLTSALRLRDASPTLATLFELQSNSGGTTYLSCTTSGCTLASSYSLTVGGNTLITGNKLAATQLAGEVPVANLPSLSGDVTGTVVDAIVGKLQGHDVSSSVPSAGQALVFNGSQWAPGNSGIGSTGNTFRFSQTLGLRASWGSATPQVVGTTAINPSQYALGSTTQSATFLVVLASGSGTTVRTRLYNVTRSEYVTNANLSTTSTTPTTLTGTLTIGSSAGNLRTSETDVYQVEVSVDSPSVPTDTAELYTAQLLMINTVN